MMHLTGRVQAWELHDHRCELLRAAAKRLKLDNLRVVSRDATIPKPELAESFDAVLVDAPCSGLGVMIDKPDIKYRISDADIQSLSLLQGKILDACSAYVKVGGRLVYSTCTILKEENQDRVKDFLVAHPEFEMDPDDSWLPGPLKLHWQRGWIQVQAHRDGIEGFFIARFRRTAS
jgi:16S rRNA (cytosine967-C5)-methyltransferase